MELQDDKADGRTQGNEKKCGAFVKIEQSGVRRKLFQEDGTDAQGAYQDFVAMNICEQGTQMCNRNWSQDFKTEAKHESAYDKEGKDISVLVISSYKDVPLMKMLESQTKVAVSNTTLPCDVSHSFPESAYRLATMRNFSLILLDVNNDYLENFLKISQSIRSSSGTNSSTPIIAFRHADLIKDEIWKKNGVTEVIYGPLYHSAVGQICDKYLNFFTQRDFAEEEDQNNINLTASATHRQDEFKVPSVPASNKFATECSIESAASKTAWPSTRNESPIQACDSTDQITPYCELDASGATVQIQDESCSAYENDKTPSSQGGAFSSCPANCIMPLSVTTVARQMPVDSAVGSNSNVAQVDANGVKTNQSGWNFIQQILDLHQNVQKDNDQKSKQVIHPLDSSTIAGTKHVSSQSPVTAYPVAAQYSTMMKNYPGAPMLPSQMPQNAGYMVSGTPEDGNMKLSLIPDEYAKHSNKERERRERIKESCDELRKILPKQLMMGRRQDMATVLEMTVYYLRVVQDHLPTVIQQQLYQSFMTYTDSKQRRKRKTAVDMTQTLPSMVQTKLQRLSNGATSNSSSGYPIISYGATNYMTQVMPPSNYQQTNTGHFPPLYHPLLSNPYHAAVNSSSIQSIYGSASLPSLDHVMHLRSQCYNENQQLQNSIPCYAVATSSPRDNGNAAVQRQDPGKASFIN